jgi:hypothetical protein
MMNDFVPVKDAAKAAGLRVSRAKYLISEWQVPVARVEGRCYLNQSQIEWLSDAVRVEKKLQDHLRSGKEVA